MRRFANLTVLLGMSVLVFASLAVAEVPRAISYQGRLTDGSGSPLDTTVSMVFTIYDDSTGSGSKWSETHPSVSVVDGLFNVILGRGTSPVPIEDSVFNQPDRWLGITVGSDPELIPRTQLVSVPYAFHADEAQLALSVADNSITDAKIVSGADIAVTKIAGTAVNLNSTQTIDGAKTFNNLEITTTKRRMTVSFAAFNPDRNGTLFRKDRFSLRNDVLLTTNVYYASFSLPDGAVVTQLEGYFFDMDASNFKLEMSRILQSGLNVMAQVSSSGTSGYQTVTDNSIVVPTIDNETYVYTLELEGFTTSHVTYLFFIGAEIEYEITKPLP